MSAVRRECGVQAFCGAKPCRRGNSFPPRILIKGVPAACKAVGLRQQARKLELENLAVEGKL